MANHCENVSPVSLLQSKDQEEILNVIDNLRSQGIGKYIDVPQIIVCGDKSSGKSSVLEAVSGIKFPTKANLATEFATELFLRRASKTSISVTILPSPDASDHEKESAKNFVAPENINLDSSGDLIKSAKAAMGLLDSHKYCSSHILRLEVCGPEQPNLTLIDLPDLFRVDGGDNQTDKDVNLVQNMAMSYMKNTRSIILAIVSAQNDFANQIVARYARDIDPTGHRTLGVITELDTLSVLDPARERCWLDIAENKRTNLRLGWHVLWNCDFMSRHYSSAQRDAKEKQFFSQGIWASFPKEHVGIKSLKAKLSAVLNDQIAHELPGLIYDVESGISDCDTNLAKLGASRATLHEQRSYLLNVSQNFFSLMRAAVDGTYTDQFFGSAKTRVGRIKRLRSVVQNTLLDFSYEMEYWGHKMEIVEVTVAKPVHSDSHEEFPVKISRSDFIIEVEDLMERSRGHEFPGTFNPLIIGDLFYEQSQRWEKIMNKATEKILDSVHSTLALVLKYTSDTTTGDGLRRLLISPAMDDLEKQLHKCTAAVLAPHQRGHPITYNDYMTEKMKLVRQRHANHELSLKVRAYLCKKKDPKMTQTWTFSIDDLLAEITQPTVDMDRFACSEAIDLMNAYYKSAMKVFVADFSVLAVEKCLLEKLPSMITLEIIDKLPENAIREIAGETPQSTAERTQILEKRRVLEESSEVLTSLNRHRQSRARNSSLEILEAEDYEAKDCKKGEENY